MHLNYKEKTAQTCSKKHKKRKQSTQKKNTGIIPSKPYFDSVEQTNNFHSLRKENTECLMKNTLKLMTKETRNFILDEQVRNMIGYDEEFKKDLKVILCNTALVYYFDPAAHSGNFFVPSNLVDNFSINFNFAEKQVHHMFMDPIDDNCESTGTMSLRSKNNTMKMLYEFQCTDETNQNVTKHGWWDFTNGLELNIIRMVNPLFVLVCKKIVYK